MGHQARPAGNCGWAVGLRAQQGRSVHDPKGLEPEGQEEGAFSCLEGPVLPGAYFWLCHLAVAPSAIDTTSLSLSFLIKKNRLTTTPATPSSCRIALRIHEMFVQYLAPNKPSITGIIMVVVVVNRG